MQSDWKINRYYNAKDFLKRTQPFLEKNEVVNMLPLGILFSLAQKSKQNKKKMTSFFATAEYREHVAFVMIVTPPYNIIVCGEENKLKAAIEKSVSFLKKERIAFPGVIGPRKIATRFASSWSKRTGCGINIQMEQMIFKLDKVNDIQLSSGKLITATQKHVDLLTDWILSFSEIAIHKLTRDESYTKAKEMVQEKKAFLWFDNTPVSMALSIRSTKNGITVSGVYTPPEYRNYGYATSCVACLSQHLLDKGYKFCSLYTDLANPTSNSIYRRIGYMPVQKSIVYNFTQPG